ncbi:cytochrome-c peroxidase [Sedimentitalea todarodis]|uniref:Cytochrome c peroxidase n=1 Tax=Sedimentitalea todarodis TaxID=1631240 RepID=A0ABU3VL66_9RHOB|nr:cytochrome c peroxidase [Sedimentitalea todarodis]MDU9006916.1 cytochrome c peroxidase [Sedimentitalea todarodis]
MKSPTTIALLLTTCISAYAADLPRPLEDRDFLWDGAPDPELYELGRSLFFDPILSGNQNISCATCHDPARGTGDGVSLSIGEGGSGLGPERVTQDGVIGRVPRNAQPLYNIGARAYTSMFHDGRLELDQWGGFPSRLRSPAKEQLPEGLDNALTAQAMFPVLSAIEMAGQPGENPVADAVTRREFKGAWRVLADRLAATPGYAQQFVTAFDDVETADDIRFDHAATAIAAFETVAFRSDWSRFDARLAGWQMSTTEEAGLQLFYGEAGCSSCHSGPLLTDHKFHAIAVPQIGPGKDQGSDGSYAAHSGYPHRVEDQGRFNVTGENADLYAFRTPSLRNAALTGPWGHNGAFASLEDMVRHHLDAVASLASYTPAELPPLDTVILPVRSRTGVSYETLSPMQRGAYDLRDTWVHSSQRLRGRIARANTLAPVGLSDDEVLDILAFLETLTDPTAVDRSYLIPLSVPSGLPPQPGRDNACSTDNHSLADAKAVLEIAGELPEPRCVDRGDEAQH